LLVELGRIYERSGELGPAIEQFHRAVTSEPTLEEAHVALMRLYARSGQRQQALRQYAQLNLILERELDARPDAATQRLYGEIVSGTLPTITALHEEPPADRKNAVRLHNVPNALTSFVGRRREVHQVRELLKTTRLLTLTGSGGVGKTRLATEVARSMLDAYPDGVWLVELAPVTDPDLVPQVVAGTLGVQEDEGVPLTTSVINSIRDRDMLVVLDNCEHVVDACAYLTEALLGHCSQIRVLATSREVLSVPGEVTWPVPPLSLPDQHSPLSPGILEEYESVRLFVERAQYRQPDFTLSPTTQPSVVRICAALDGLPLAIELAAARVGVLSVEGIAARLEDTLTLLSGGGRTREPRQQTMRGVLDWSYNLLSTPEQQFFDRLAVFAGGWTLDAAEAIDTPSYGGDHSTLDVLSRLVDKSLVLTEAQPDGHVRYRLLEPVRQYAREHLRESGEADAIHRCHAAYSIRFTTEAAERLRGADQAAALEDLDREHANLRAALQWSLEAGGDPEMGLQLASNLWLFWYSRGYFREGVEWYDAILAASSDTPSPARAQALRGAGALYYARRDLDTAEGLIGRALEMCSGFDEPIILGGSLNGLAVIAMDKGEVELALRYHEEALALRRQTNDIVGVAVTLCNLANITRMQGDLEHSRRLYEESIALSREVEDISSVAITMNNLGSLLLELGEMERAISMFAETLHIWRDLSDTLMLATCLDSMGEAAHLAGDSVLATRIHGAAEATRDDLGTTINPREREQFDEHFATLRETLGDDQFASLWQAGKSMGLDAAIDLALTLFHSSPTDVGEQDGAHTDGSPSILTRREGEVAALIAEGYTNAEIATHLGMAPRTADTHVSNILRKLAVSSRTEVASWLVKHAV
jgi:predicted ATPase/DNA-binding CsgD family transcriptional regulator